HWVKGHDTLLANVHDSLRSGGVVRFNFAGDGNCGNFFLVLREAMAHPTGMQETEAFRAVESVKASRIQV
ncbi:MAG TPA: hypothetical protein VFG19_00605, partial [Geobacteraceae bacterium]|nr:hypothetical protein [Geobacteraceae bacterium]